jgi:hypothetical protein
MFKRILQNSTGEIIELNNKKVEKFLCVQVKNDETGDLTPCVFWLKVFEQNNWNRFFVDEIMCAWDVYEELNENDFNDDEFPFFDVCQKYDLKGLKIGSIISKEVFSKSINYNKLTIEFLNNTELVIETDMNGNRKIIKIDK